MWVRPESGWSAHAWQPGDYEPPLSGEPSKKFPMPGEMGAGVALEGGGSIAGLEKAWGTTRGQKEKTPGGELYTRDLSHRRRLSSASSSFSLCPYLRCSYSFFLYLLLFPFNQPPVVFHLAGAPLEPTKHHRIPYSEARA